MFNMKKFLQVIGVSIIINVIFSIVMGLSNMENYLLFVFVQMVVTYGSLGVFSVMWVPKTPYISAYLGAVIISLLNILFAYYVFNIMVFVDPEGINRSMSWAVILALITAFITNFVMNKKMGQII
ncbi:MAG: hypothetical protein ACE3JQ_01085 [Paenisporosarcina sp.]